MKNQQLSYQDKLVIRNHDSFCELLRFLRQINAKILLDIKNFEKNRTREMEKKLYDDVGYYAAQLCKYSHYYRPLMFTYPIRDEIYEHKWCRESVAIEKAPDKHTKTVLENDYRQVSGDKAIVYYLGDSGLNNGNMVYIRYISPKELETAISAIESALEAHRF